MFKRVLNAVAITFALFSLLSCSEKRGIEHRIEGSFYKDTILDSYNRETIQYFMNLKNDEWDIKCKKTGIILDVW